MTVDLTNLRKEFRQNGLNKSELDDNPFNQFSLWFSQAIKVGIVEPSAMSLATADENEIGIRTVLLKHFDDKGFVFFTNYGSKKSKSSTRTPGNLTSNSPGKPKKRILI